MGQIIAQQLTETRQQFIIIEKESDCAPRTSKADRVAKAELMGYLV